MSSTTMNGSLYYGTSNTNQSNFFPTTTTNNTADPNNISIMRTTNGTRATSDDKELGNTPGGHSIMTSTQTRGSSDRENSLHQHLKASSPHNHQQHTTDLSFQNGNNQSFSSRKNTNRTASPREEDSPSGSEIDTNQGANDLLMTAATALASISSGHKKIREPTQQDNDTTNRHIVDVSITDPYQRQQQRIMTADPYYSTPPFLNFPNMKSRHTTYDEDYPENCEEGGGRSGSTPSCSSRKKARTSMVVDRHHDSLTTATANTFLTSNKSQQIKHKATRFPVKLMHILSSGIHDHIICWTHDGLSFVVKKPNLLVSEVLPSYFKEVKYSSFTRKLHRWGFVKILRGKELSAYFHKDFRRGDYESCAEMSCSKSGTHGGMDVMSHVLLQKNLAPARKIQEQIQQEKEQILQEQILNEQYAREHVNRNDVSRFSNSENIDQRYHAYNNTGILHPQLPVPGEALVARPVLNQHQQVLTGYTRFPNVPYGTNYRFRGHPFFAIPTMEDLQMEKTRHSLEHRRIIDDAMNALRWEQARSRGVYYDGQPNMNVAHLSSTS